jgi:hypothetical protein
MHARVSASCTNGIERMLHHAGKSLLDFALYRRAFGQTLPAVKLASVVLNA